MNVTTSHPLSPSLIAIFSSAPHSSWNSPPRQSIPRTTSALHHLRVKAADFPELHLSASDPRINATNAVNVSTAEHTLEVPPLLLWACILLHHTLYVIPW